MKGPVLAVCGPTFMKFCFMWDFVVSKAIFRLPVSSFILNIFAIKS